MRRTSLGDVNRKDATFRAGHKFVHKRPTRGSSASGRRNARETEVTKNKRVALDELSKIRAPARRTAIMTRCARWSACVTSKAAKLRNVHDY